MKSKVRKISVSPNPGEPNENGDTLRSNSICHRIVCGVYTCCVLKIIFLRLKRRVVVGLIMDGVLFFFVNNLYLLL